MITLSIKLFTVALLLSNKRKERKHLFRDLFIETTKFILKYVLESNRESNKSNSNKNITKDIHHLANSYIYPKLTNKLT
ncbi:hypothetical protein NQ318_003828 [Aromia moschata]|uniref:Uncharacterized protein n=1 Tax=Aromia moschata TaxID=1265417 RepID=A0AAV8XXD2_9CUCU|nr:hypothetical protein NQ318_003828 [Aromia moschata]